MPVNLTSSVRSRALFTLFVLTLLTALILVPSYFRSSAGSKGKGTASSISNSSADPALPYYDIRLDKNAYPKLASFRDSVSKNASQVADIRDRFVAGERALAERVPTLKIEYNPDIKIPEVIAPDPTKGTAFLTTASNEKRSDILLNFLRQNAALTGVNTGQVDQLKVFADYTNPSGNMSFVEIDQEINGIPVFRGEIKAAFSKNGEMARIINNLAPGLDYETLSTDFGDPFNAVSSAAANINHKLTPGETSQNKAESTDLKAVFGSGDWATTAEKMYFPTEPGVAVPAWRILIWQPVNAFYVIVDAGTGTMLWRKNITNDQTQPATFNVYSSTTNLGQTLNSPAPGSPIAGTPDPSSNFQAPLVNRTDVTLIGNEGPLSFNSLGWISDNTNGVNGFTDGNAVQAGLDIDTTNGVDAPVSGTNRVFSFAWTPSNVTGGIEGGDAPTGTAARNGAVTQLFYLNNRYHDALYAVGFNELARNFQNDNFGRGGVAPDRVSAEAQDSTIGSSCPALPCVNNANFATPADGGRGRMQMYLFTNSSAPQRDGSLDAEVVWHEHTHGTSNRLIGNGSGLGGTQSGGMGEGWSDLFAFLLATKTGDPTNGVYTTGSYVTYKFANISSYTSNYYYGIRRFPYAVKSATGGPNNRPYNPLTFADIDPGKISCTDGAFSANPVFGCGSATEVHNEGEVWAMTGIEVWSRIATRLGHDLGTLRTLQLYTDAMKVTPLSPTFLQARDAILAAAQTSGGTDVDDIWAGFAARGMGFSASNASGNTVVEGFDLPNLLQTPTFAVSDAQGDNDGFFEPGEPLTLSIPLTNSTGRTATGVTLQVVGGGSANYGTINNNTTVTQQVTFTVPAAAACGTALTLTFNVNSSLGSTSFTRTIVIGQPTLTSSQTFDGVTAPAIPAGWTATSVLGGVNWVTTTTNADSAPNSVFGVDTAASASEMDLTSPSMPITSGAATVSFRNRFDTEAAWDGTVLEISIAGGAFTDILTAGGAFVSNGYNGTMTAAAASPTYTPNPLNGRQGWTGNSNGFVTTIVRLPAAASGQNVQLRWRMGSDDNTAGIGPNSGSYIDSIQVFGSSVCSFSPTSVKSRGDFDGDGKTDYSVYRPTDHNWYTIKSTGGVSITNWGNPGDTPMPRDYDGDGKADVAVYRASAGQWFVIRSSDSTVSIAAWGNAGDLPEAIDYDGDGKTDIAVYRPSTGVWYALRSTDNGVTITAWGNPGDIAVPGNYDNDAKADIAVYRPSTGVWYTLRSTDGGVGIAAWGNPGDVPMPADYDGDNRDDQAVYRPSTGVWYTLRSSDGGVSITAWGNSTDIPVPGDYDGDGKDDVAVYRNGTWLSLQSTAGVQIAAWGAASDTPIPATYNP